VLIVVATKVLHHKRPALVPMLDSAPVRYYAERLGQPRLVGHATGEKNRAADAASTALGAFRADLVGVPVELEAIRAEMASAGYQLTALRILEVLLWMDCEDRGYYR
jgi:Family of unknown function (DUF6308)